MINSCQSPMHHAWYLKYDSTTISSNEFLDQIEELIKVLNINVSYLPADDIIDAPQSTMAWISEIQFSSNSFDRRIQEFIIGILSYLTDFFKNEIVCNENPEAIEKSYNFMRLETHYCQIFWKSAPNKPIPDFLRDRLFCTLFRLETLLLSLHRSQCLCENEAFSGVLRLLSEILKSLMLEMEPLRESYEDHFQYLLRLFNLLKFLMLVEDVDELEEVLSEVFPLGLVKKLMTSLLEKSRNKNSFKLISNSYRLLVEDSFSELQSNRKEGDIDSDFIVKRLSSKNHSNSFQKKNSTDEEFDALDRLSKRASKSIGVTLAKMEKMTTAPQISNSREKESPKLQKTLTFKDSEVDETESIPFLDKLANSYLTTQIMNTQSFITSSSHRANTVPSDDKGDLSIIHSKMLLKSPNLPFNSILGMHLSETAIDDALGSKIVANLKNKRLPLSEPEAQHNRLTPSLMTLQPSRQNITLLKKKSELGDKINQNLYNILLSKDSNQIGDNIIIAKNRGKTTPKIETVDNDTFFEKRRRDRIIMSNRESSIKESGDEFMTKSNKKPEEKHPEKTSLQSNDERKPKELTEKDRKEPKKIDLVIVKEKDLIKINKDTKITEELTRFLGLETAAPEPFDEDIIEETEEDEELEKSKQLNKKVDLLDFKQTFHGEEFQERNEEFWFLPGVRINLERLGFQRTNIMSFFTPLHNLSARRRDMYNQISQSLLLAKDNLYSEHRETLLYRKRSRNMKSTSEAIFVEIQ